MNKNTVILMGAIGVIIIGVVAWATGSKKNTPPTSTITNTVNTATVPAADFTVTMTDFAFTPTEFTAGLSQTIKVNLVNQATTAHAFVFDTLDFNSGVIEPGQSKVVTFTTPSTAGRYGWHCDQADHKDQGMVGMMIVQ